MNSVIKNILITEGLIPDSDKTHYLVRCPFHNERNGTALSIDLNKNAFRCFSGKCIPRGIYGNLEKLCQLLGHNVKDKRFKYQHVSTMFKPKESKLGGKELQEFDLDKFQQYHNKFHKYLTDRNISKEICEVNKVSYSVYHRRLYIPFWQDKVCYGAVGRTDVKTNEYEAAITFIMRKEHASRELVIDNLSNGFYNDKYEFIKRTTFYHRYKNTFGLEKNLLVYEPLSNKDTDFLVLTEGMINALSCNSFGVDANSIIGSYPTEIQVRRVLKNSSNKQLILGFDNDLAGQNNIKVFRQRAKKPVASFNWKLLKGSDINDINQLTKEQFYYLLKNPSFM